MVQEDTGATLTKLTFMGRQAIKFGLIAIVALIVGRTVLNASITLWRALNPPRPAAPTVGFSLLPPLQFPQQTAAQQPSQFILETATGGLPDFPDRAKVFFQPPAPASLLNDQATREIAAGLGFVFEPEATVPRYRFSKSEPLISQLSIDPNTKNFELSTNYLSRPELILEAQPPNTEQAIRQVRSVLTQTGLLQDDIATVSAETTLLRTTGTQVEQAVSFSEAELVQVNIRRAAIDNLFETYTPQGTIGPVSALVVNNRRLPNTASIVSLSLQYFPVDYTQVETYPLRPVQQAWNILRNGEGYVASGQNLEQAIIRKVTLGYYDNFEYQEYFQPIYVFEGDDGFLGYVPALDPQWIQVSDTQF